MVLMSGRLFEMFEEVVERLPAQCVLKAFQLQRQMLKEDVLKKRTLPISEIRSIFAFCDFLESARDSIPMPPVRVPLWHIAFYRGTVIRLIEAGELPDEAITYFDATFSASILNSLRAA